MAFRATCHVIGNESPSLPDRPGPARGRILGSLQFKLGIDLGAEQNDVE
jgi:hypothetical protein